MSAGARCLIFFASMPRNVFYQYLELPITLDLGNAGFTPIKPTVYVSPHYLT